MEKECFPDQWNWVSFAHYQHDLVPGLRRELPWAWDCIEV